MLGIEAGSTACKTHTLILYRLANPKGEFKLRLEREMAAKGSWGEGVFLGEVCLQNKFLSSEGNWKSLSELKPTTYSYFFISALALFDSLASIPQSCLHYMWSSLLLLLLNDHNFKMRGYYKNVFSKTKSSCIFTKMSL